MWGGEAALLFRLRDALSDRVLEGPLCLRPPYRILEWLGLFHRLHPHDWPADSFHRRPGFPLWMHHWPERFRDCSGVCCTWNFGAR